MVVRGAAKGNTSGKTAVQRSDLEHLCRYITRLTIAHERLSVNRARQMALRFRAPCRDGTSHLVMSPLEFMQRLAALVPRLHLIRFHGMLAPHAKLRAAIVPIAATAGRRLRARAGRVSAHEVGAVVEASVRYRTLRTVRR